MNTPSPVARREREKERRRQTILDAAGRVFAARGFHGASMNEIAREAELAPGTLYLYFKDKGLLYAALFMSKLGAMVGQIEEAAREGADPLESLRNAVRAHMEFNDRNREFLEVVTRHRPADQREHDREWKTAHETMARHLQALTRMIEAAQRRKLIRPGSSRAFANALLGSVLHTSHDLALSHGPLTHEPEFIFDLFLNGAKRPAVPTPA